MKYIIAGRDVKRLILKNLHQLARSSPRDWLLTSDARGALHHHLFVRPDNRQLLFVWDRTGSPTVRIGTRPGTSVTEYALDGTARQLDSFDGRILQDVRLTAGVVRIFEVRP